jgi:hypothetical protein
MSCSSTIMTAVCTCAGGRMANSLTEDVDGSDFARRCWLPVPTPARCTRSIASWPISASATKVRLNGGKDRVRKAVEYERTRLWENQPVDEPATELGL